MNEQVPKNHVFLKFIVIFMGILIVLGLCGIVWKVIDLAKQKAAREKSEAISDERTFDPIPLKTLSTGSFSYDLILESGEQILETSAGPNGLWIRIGKGGSTNRIILKDMRGKTVGTIQVKQGHEDVIPAS